MSRPNLRRLEVLTRGRRTPGDGVAFREARGDLSQWLVAGREGRGLSREQVAQITRIQLRTIERLEDGRFDELPADVFVRGFIRGYARCVGLPEDEALARYGSCGFAAAPVASAQAQALLDSLANLAPEVGRSVVGPSRAPRPTDEAAPVAAMMDVDTALARAALEVPLARGSLRDIPAIRATGAGAGAVAVAVAVDEAPAPTEVLAAMAVGEEPSSAEAGAGDGPAARKRRRKGEKVERSAAPMERDARGRFVRRTGAIAVVDPVALGLAVEAAALDDATSVQAGKGAAGGEVASDVTELAAASSAPASTSASPSESFASDAAAFAEREELAAGERAADVAFADGAIDVEIEPEPAVAIAVTGPSSAVSSAATSSPAIAVPLLTSASASGRFGRTTGGSVPIPPRTSGLMVAPTLVIDDDDPEDAERAREQRRKDAEDPARGWRSFIPPALLDQQRGRQGGLTLAVIILLIVATLTLSYLMRRPSSSGDGITAVPAATLDRLA